MSDTMTIKANSHSIWDDTGFLIQATNEPGVFLFADLNPEAQFKHRLTRWERLRIGVWFIRQVIFP